MKRCLISFVGLSRTFETTYPDILETIVVPNMDRYEFDYCVHTDITNRNTPHGERFKNINKNSGVLFDQNEFEQRLKSVYGHRLKYIFYDDMKGYNCGCHIFKRRSSIVLENIGDVYDMYIFIRMDAAIIAKNFDIDDFIGKMTLIPSDYMVEEYSRPHHNRDLDYCMMGNYDSIMAYVHPETSENWNLFKGIHFDEDALKAIGERYSLKGREFVHFQNEQEKFNIYRNILNLESKGYEYYVSSCDSKIYSTIVRSIIHWPHYRKKLRLEIGLLE